MIGTQVADTDGVSRAIATARFDLAAYDAFIDRHLGPADGHASDRFVERFLGPRRGPVGRTVVPFRAMSATSEAPAAFRQRRRRPGCPSARSGEGIDDILSRRRLVRYLVQADMQQAGRGHPARATSGGSSTRCSRCSCTGSSSRSSCSAALPDYPLFIFSAILPWKWFTASVGDATPAVSSQDRLIKQIAFPEARPAGRGDDGRGRRASPSG